MLNSDSFEKFEDQYKEQLGRYVFQRDAMAAEILSYKFKTDTFMKMSGRFRELFGEFWSTRVRIISELPDLTTAQLTHPLTEPSLDIGQSGIHSEITNHINSECIKESKRHAATTEENRSDSNTVSKGQLKSIFSGSHLRESAPDEGVEVSLEISLAST
mmetsp:Transcript_14549/g.20201  ORF Transcript_14549/g.20201 Transcript_14549/m.20201 type:complete len:159 (+) Transcript_14549:948-1424(+)